MSRVLSTAASEPSVIRWLHALDPDRNLSGELLRSSVRYTTMLAASEEAKPGMPRETASLFIPMYRRGSLVLGQLYGPMSPNTLALAGLCAPQPPPTPRSRRFVVDLASTNPIEFVEYEWFTDGKLAVSLHDMTEDGVYSGQTIIFDGKAAPGSPVPSRVAMRLYYSEAPQSGRTPLPPDWRDRLSSWESWTRQFASLRAGSTRVTVRFTVPRPDELPIQGERITNLTEECAVGECGFQMSSANKLVRMFLQAAGMFVSHPSQDQPVADSADRRAFTDAVKALYDEDDREATLEEFLSPDTEPMGAETSSALVPSPLSPQKTATSTAALPVERSPPIQPSALSAPAVSLLDPVAPDAAPPPKTVDAPPAVKSPAPPNVAAPTAVTSRPAYAGISKPGAREHVCECGMRFSHRGHFNAHRRAVHEKIRPHKCSYQSCERYVVPFRWPCASY